MIIKVPKSLFINPSVLDDAESITAKEIPVNTYKKTVKESGLSKKDLSSLCYRILLIREFETALKLINEDKTHGYLGLKYDYKGPLHLSIGQEAAAVGQAFVLDGDDMIFGSHRGHADLLARGLTEIERTPENKLSEIMKGWNGGRLFEIIDANFNCKDIREKAEYFLLLGAMCEIFSKADGFQRGMSGSMHVFFPPFGVYPNNAIVGASAPIATGAALYKKIQKKKGITVANIGDGALGSGVVYESMNFAAMDQYNTLWREKGGLPIIFAISDNGYGMGGQTTGETMAYGAAARLGMGISPCNMHAERINGNNPLAVIDAFKRKKKLIAEGFAPVLLDIVTYRLEGHSQSDKSAYRIDAEIEAWKKKDPAECFPKDLEEAGILDRAETLLMRNRIVQKVYDVTKLVVSDTLTPYFDFSKNEDYLEKVLFSNEKYYPKDQAEVLIKKEENARIKEIKEKGRANLTLGDAVFEAVTDRFYTDELLISYGEEVREWGGISGVYSGLCESLPYERLFNTPISEAAIVSTAVGYAMAGGRAVIEIMFSDFIARAGDEIINQLAKWQSMSAGYLKLPVVLRVSVGAKYGTQHSQDLSAVTAHIPGLKVVYPTTPYDAKGLMNAALSGSDPVLFFESQRLYKMTEIFKKEVPEDYYEIEIGEPDIKIEGKDITLLSVGATLYRAAEAVKILAEKHSVFAELIDARSITPFNYGKVVESVKKTGGIIIIGDGAERVSVMKEFAAEITEKCFGYLKNAPKVLGAKNTVIPPNVYDKECFVQAEDIVKAVCSHTLFK